MLKIGVKYCGGCNPEIDRPAVIERVEKIMEQRGREMVLVTNRQAKIDILFLVNGCRHACLEEEYALSDEDIPVVSIRGEMVGNEPVIEEDIPQFLIEKLIKSGWVRQK